MIRFAAEFLAASFCWVGFLFASGRGLVELPSFEQSHAAVTIVEADKEEHVDEAPTNSTSKRRRRGRGHDRRGMNRRGRRALGNYAVNTGEDLGEGGPRDVNAGASGGEEQLTSFQIEAVFDRSLGGTQRCLVLVPPEENPRGRIIFGRRVGGSGSVRRVNLRGPASVTQSDAGGCLRRIAQGQSSHRSTDQKWTFATRFPLSRPLG